MAYISQEQKAKIAPMVKAICDKYGVKATMSIHRHTALNLNIKSGKIDFIGNVNRVMAERPGGYRNGSPAKDYIQVNEFWYHEHFDGVARDFLKEVITALNTGNHDNSDIQSDYFDVGWYLRVNVGSWDKPYILV
jgi:hypothetical protein